MRQRKLWVSASALGVAVVLVAVITVVLQRPTAYETDSTTVEPAAALDRTGPAPGSLRQVWKRRVPAAEGRQYGLYSLNPAGTGLLLRAAEDGLHAYDATTGKPGWHYGQQDRVLDDVAVTRDGIMARFRAGGDDHDPDSVQIVSIDPATGEELWRSDEPWRRQKWAQEPLDPRVGVVPVQVHRQGAAIDEVRGVRAEDGEVAWTISENDVEEACGQSGGAEANGHTEGGGDDGEGADTADVRRLVVTDIPCPFASDPDAALEVTAGIDADSGTMLWTRTSDDDYRVAAGITMARGTQRGRSMFRLLGSDGRSIHEGASAPCTDCGLFAADGDRVVLAHPLAGEPDEPGSGRRMRIVQVDTTTATSSSTTVEIGEPAGPAVLAGDKLYATVVPDDRYGNTLEVLATVDLASGEATLSPLPILGVDLRARLGAAGYETPTLLHAAGDRLVLAHTPMRDRGNAGDGTAQRHELISSYEQRDTSEPVELSGVSPDEWPRACDLLRKATRTFHAERPNDERPTFTPHRGTVNGVEIPEIVCAAPVPPAGLATVRVSWVAPTAERAETLFPKEQATGSDVRVLRVGRVILQVKELDSVPATDRLVARLREEPER